MKNTKIQNDQTVHGITIRTKNSDEMNPETAKIGKLWESFYKDVFPKLEKGAPIYSSNLSCRVHQVCIRG